VVPYVEVVMGSGRECGAICGSNDGSGRECGATCGSGDGEWEGVRGYLWEW
jgi:hypothetical protein